MRRMVGFSTCRQVLIGPNLATVCKSRACSQQLPHDTMVSPSTMLKLIKGSSPDFRCEVNIQQGACSAQKTPA